MNQLVCIVGPTGTGKTSYALGFAKKQPSILISADSRQVYRGMDIVTGKDHPKNINIFGIDIVNPDKPCSVSVWMESVMPNIEKAWDDGKLPIVVGGTGLYVKALTEGIPTMSVPIDESLRLELGALSLGELQSQLRELNPKKFESMNNSDKQNPRRLVRAIEVTSDSTQIDLAVAGSKSFKIESKLIGLAPPNQDVYKEIILKRVLSRLEQGAVEETKSLLKKYDKNLQSMSAIGYKSIVDFLGGKITKDQLIVNWVEDEIKYAKRQLTWFRKQPVIWYDVGNMEG